jgi:hypothetical protein
MAAIVKFCPNPWLLRRISCNNRVMARGWESKDVESQVESAKDPNKPFSSGNKPTEVDERSQQRKDLELSRIRIANDLATATNPNHRKTLEAALAHLDKKIEDLT